MIDVPADDEGLSWIVSRNPTKLLLVPGLRSASLIAAAAGDDRALKCVRLTAQHFAAYAGAFSLNPLDTVCLVASRVHGMQAYSTFLAAIQRNDPQLASIFDDGRNHTRALLEEAVVAGELAAMKWLYAICPLTCFPESTLLMSNAAAHEQLAVLRYLRSVSEPKHWDTERGPTPNLECIKWLLSADVPGGP